MKLVRSILAGCATLICAHVQALAVEPDVPTQLIGRLEAASILLQETLSKKFRSASEIERHERGAMVEFYGEPGRQLLWVTADGLNHRAREVKQVFARAHHFDLRPQDYELPDFEGLAKYEGYPAEWLAAAELKISRAVLAYARHAQAGHINPRSLGSNFDLKPPYPDPYKVLEGLAQENVDIRGYLEGFNPRHPQFEALRKKLLELRRFAERANSVTIPDGPVIKPGERHPHIALVRKRLDVQPVDQGATSGKEDAGSADTLYDERLVEAVEHFQRVSGLHVDGLIGPATRRAFNRPVDEKIAIIRANLERWRWMPSFLGKRYVNVNIPEFLVRVVKDQEVIHVERVVVGKPKFATPVLADEMEMIVLNPYWNVPYSIAKNEILPIARRNPDYITRNRLQVLWRGRRAVDPYRIDWEDVDVTKIRLRQPPGRGNALGELKFMFPNRHSVYLHDTPSKHLFTQTVRAFSHGCMRVRNPRKLAEILLGPQGWTAKRIAQAIGTGANRTIPLKEKIPVYLTYFTAAVDEDGALRLFNDIYRYDRQLINALKL